jgi:ubiquinone/menaquinone biosynthesis C-methylase UbiE
MIDRGYRMTCLDIGDNLLDIARQKFNETDARFINVSFEDWKPDRAYDLVMSATAWHWINKDIGYMKAAQVLSTDGGIALFWNKHPTPYSGFFEDVQVLYDDVIPRGEKQVQSTEDWIKEQKQAIQDSRYFTQVEVREYPWSIRFSRDQYISLLNTYSDHINLPRNKKKQLYTGIAEIIDSDYNGFVDRPYLSILFTAKKIN